MQNTKPQARAATAVQSYSAVGDFLMLIKARLTLLVVFTAVMGYLITVGISFEWIKLVLVFVGGLAVTGAANALNQVLEKDFDILMQRTADRPLASGRMKVSEGVFIAGMLCLIGVTALAAINPIASMLGMTSLVLYAFLYTPMKRYTTLSVWVGGIPGALPIMIGCVAGQGTITWLAVGLFVLQYFWQLPHFWSIGYLSFQDYSDAGYKVVPTDNEGEVSPRLGTWSVIITLLMIGTFAFLGWFGLISFWAMVLGGIVTLGYTYFSWKFNGGMTKDSARSLMFSSFLYLPLVLFILILF